MPTVYLIRHAEAEPWWNGGDASRPLSERGRRQAAWMADHLRNTPVDILRCAPHRRCVETAEIIGRALGLQPHVDESLHIARSFHVRGLEGTSVWVAHSNNIPDAVAELGAPGRETGLPSHRCGHASAWKLVLDHGGQLIGAEYTEPDA
jgi:phosphohistidine phosphatase SixA